MKTYQVYITGRVQGVGFRPYVYHQARRFLIHGQVNNVSGGVFIEFNSDSSTSAHEFYHSLINQAPHLSIIKSHSISEIPGKSFIDFKICESDTQEKVSLLLSPDFAICHQCRKELNDSENQRYRYPFITCTNCGPRFSIINSLPYDRHRTTMDHFHMCDSCHAEYESVEDRRFYSQTNSCPDCRITMTAWNPKGQLISENQEEIISIIRKYIFEEHKIVALKGIGGYLILADACSEASLNLLRERKKRKSKPFALLYPNIETLKEDCRINDNETLELQNNQSPIVLVPLLKKPKSGIKIGLIAPGLSQLGVMIPYTGLYDLILEGKDQPIVATSGNISDSPIVYENEMALLALSKIADLIITNDREICIPQDDSIVRFSPGGQNKIILRRSRGMAPSFRKHAFDIPVQECLAFGAELKGSFSILANGEIYTSQYLGNLSNYESERSYGRTIKHLIQILQCNPEIALIDSHPDYSVSRLGKTWAKTNNVGIKLVQHHKAHFGAVLAENELIKHKGPILGVIWDGTGFGEDNQVWGGEFFIYQDLEIKRIGHMEYVDHLAGDKMPKEPRLSCMAFMNCNDIIESIIRSKFSDKEWAIYQHLLKKEELKTSSVGRLFDAAASLLGLCDYNEYEGQAAMLLEKEAISYYEENELPESYSIEMEENLRLSGKQILFQFAKDFSEGRERGYCALRFHVTLAETIFKFAKSLSFHQIAFSGGVFQNALLVDLIVERLDESFNLYFHKEMSPNDENVSYGQVAIHYIESLKKNKVIEPMSNLIQKV